MSSFFSLNRLLLNQNFRNVVIYFFSGGFSRSIPFFLLPLLTRVLSPSDFGILGLLMLAVQLLTPFMTFHAPGYVFAHYFKYSSDEINHRLAVILSFAASVAYLIAALVTVLFFTGILHTGLPLWSLLVVVIMAFATGLLNLVQALNQIETRIKRFVTYEVTNALLIGAMVVILIVFVGMKWEGRILAGLIGILVVGTVATIYLIRSRSLSLVWDSSSLMEIFKFSAPILPHVFGMWALNGIARLFLAKYVNLDEAGYFQVAFQFTMILTLFYQAMFKVWNPYFYRNIGLCKTNPQIKKSLARYTNFYIVGVLLLAGGFLLSSQLFIHVFVYEKFARSALYLTWIVSGVAVHNVSKCFSGFLINAGKTVILGISAIISAVANIALAFIMNRYFGPIGVAQATFTAFTIHTLLIITITLKSNVIPWMSTSASKLKS